MENLEYKIVLDIVLAEAQVDSLKQKLSDTGKEVDTVNSKGLDNLGKSAQEATKDVDKLNKALDKTKEATDKAKDAAKDAGKAANKASTVGTQWAEGFSVALDGVDQSIGNITPGFAELVGSVKGALPIVKSVNDTAVKGLGKVKAAIIGTGIGILIIGVAQLIAHWKELGQVLEKVIGPEKMAKVREGIAKIKDALMSVITVLVSKLTGLANAIGKFLTGVVKSLWKLVTLDFKGALDAANDALSFGINFKQGEDVAKRTIEAIASVAKEASDDVTEHQDKNTKSSYNTARKSIEDLKKEQLKAIQEEHDARVKALDSELAQGKINIQEYNKQLAVLNGALAVRTGTISAGDIKDFQTLTQALGNLTEDRLKGFSEEVKKAATELRGIWQIGEDTKNLNGFMSAEDALKRINVLKEAGLITVTDEVAMINSLIKGEDVQAKLLNEIDGIQVSILSSQKQLTSNKLVQADLDKKIAENELNQQMRTVEAIQNQIKVLNAANKGNMFTQDIFELENALDTAAKGLQQLQFQLKHTEDGVATALADMVKVNPLDTLLAQYMSLFDTLDQYYEQGLMTYEQYEAAKTHYTEEYSKQREEILVAQAQEEVAQAQEEVDKYQASLEAAQDAIDQVLSIGDGISSRWGDAFAVLHQGFNQLEVDLKSGKKDWTTWANSAANAIGAASQITQALADQEDSSTKEGFNRQKRLQKASVILSGIQGGVAAVTNAIRDLGFPTGLIVGGTTAATIAALTTAQVAAIERTSFEGSGTTSSAPSISVTPVVSGIDESLPTQTVVTNQQDQRVYILESDIQSSNKRVQVREENTTF